MHGFYKLLVTFEYLEALNFVLQEKPEFLCDVLDLSAERDVKAFTAWIYHFIEFLPCAILVLLSILSEFCFKFLCFLLGPRRRQVSLLIVIKAERGFSEVSRFNVSEVNSSTALVQAILGELRLIHHLINAYSNIVLYFSYLTL